MHTFNRREYPLKTSKQTIQIQRLIQQFNQQLKINSSNHPNFNSQSITNNRLPLIQQRSKLHSDRFISERLKYQHNLHTIIDEIKDKMETARKSSPFRSTKKRRQILPQSPIKLLNKTEFKIKSINLQQDDSKHKQQLAKSYIESTQKRLAQQKRNIRARYQRFNFQPWATSEQTDAIQTVQL